MLPSKYRLSSYHLSPWSTSLPFLRTMPCKYRFCWKIIIISRSALAITAILSVPSFIPNLAFSTWPRGFGRRRRRRRWHVWRRRDPVGKPFGVVLLPTKPLGSMTNEQAGNGTNWARNRPAMSRIPRRRRLAHDHWAQRCQVISERWVSMTLEEDVEVSDWPTEGRPGDKRKEKWENEAEHLDRGANTKTDRKRR